MPLAAGEGDGRVVAHHLARNHGERLAWVGIDLAGHDRAARLVLGQMLISPMPAARAASPAGGCRWRSSTAPSASARQRAVREHQRIVRGERLELVRAR